MRRNGMGIAAIVALATIAPSSAHAALIFDLTTPVSNSSAGSFGNVLTYSMGTGAAKLQMRATAWSVNTANTSVQNAALNIFSGGLGIRDQGEANTSPDHAIDNSSLVDFILLQFDKAVDLNALNIGWYSGDSDVTIRWGSTGTAWNSTPTLTPALLTSNFAGTSDANNVGSAFTGWRDVNMPTMATSVIISARSGQTNDYFKVQSIQVTPVPEPATWMAMLAGFGAIGVAQRRRRKAEPQEKLQQA